LEGKSSKGGRPKLSGIDNIDEDLTRLALTLRSRGLDK